MTIVTSESLRENDALREMYFARIKADHDAVIDTLKVAFLHKEVTLVATHPPISRGRAAYIEGITVLNGVPKFLCMVLRSGSETEFLNTDGWTRSYRSWDEFIILPEDLHE